MSCERAVVGAMRLISGVPSGLRSRLSLTETNSTSTTASLRASCNRVEFFGCTTFGTE
jgi:hypothetical protein